MSTQTYNGVSVGVAEDFFTKALMSGFVLDGPAPTTFVGNCNFGLTYKGKVEFSITYDSVAQVALVSITRKDFPYKLVPDAAIYSQIATYVYQAKNGTLQPNMSVWGNERHANEVRWGGFARPYFHRRKKHNLDGSIRFNLSEVSYTVPVTAATLTAPASSGTGAGRQFGFSVTGATGQSYVVQASTNLINWTNIYRSNGS